MRSEIRGNQRITSQAFRSENWIGQATMEWKDEVTKDINTDGGHRHTNHLFWLHPGSAIVAGRSEWDNKYAEAMKVTLNTRGDAGTGWSKAWKLNFWARLHDR